MPDPTLIPVYGHEWAQRLLQSAVLSGRASHAYLFVGPDQIGKTTMARAFAQALTCESPQAGAGLGACGRCRACRLAAEGGHPDHRMVEPAGGQLKIEQVRDLIQEAMLSPVEGRTKVFIIPSFERANLNAANALLKTLEEPSPTTRILLTSNESSSLLATITSRCQTMQLRPVPAETVAAALQTHWQTPEEQASLLAGLSGGRLGWAVQVATQPQLWQRHESQLQAAQDIVKQSVNDRLSLAADLVKETDVELLLRDWLMWWRDVMLAQQGCLDLVVNRNRLGEVQSLARNTRPGEVRRFIEALMTTAGYLRTNVSAQLAVEALLLKAPIAS
ncbi:MAG: DNA polymerase III subunit delta' [Caldilineales bacterium]|nr:DNA polymerase III subunit delta' [Caldilineales bacterium]